MVQATASNKGILEASGYRITEMIGFDSHTLPLYTHKNVSDKKRGDMAFKAHVGDPRQLNSAETVYLSRKASEGFFTWKPSECMSHKFQNITFAKDGLGRAVTTRSEPTMGCKWCREEQAKLPPAPVVMVQEVAPSPVPVASVIIPKEKCKHCDFTFKDGRFAKTSRTVHMRSHAMRSTTPEGVPEKAVQKET